MNIINTSKKPRIQSRPKHRIHWVKGAEIKKKKRGIDKLLNEIIAENFPNLEKQVDVQMQTTFNPLNRHYQKRISP